MKYLNHLFSTKARLDWRWPICLFLLTINLLTESCSKLADIHPIEQNPISLAKQQFLKDSTAFWNTGAKPTYNFRQSLERGIHWEKAFIADSLIYVPISLILPEGMTVNGSKKLPNETWLIIQIKKNNSEYAYRMMTLFPDTVTHVQPFSGTIFVEDYFNGNVSYAEYMYGSRLRRKEKIRTQQTANELRANMPVDCSLVKIATVCVGDVNGGSAPDICGDRYEYQCQYLNEGDGEWPLPGSSGGGSNNGNNNGNNTIAFTALAPTITIDIKKRLECFKSVPDNANTKYNITLHAQKGIGGGNKPGHAFITLEKSNGSNMQRLSYGFYPVSSLQSGTMQSVPSAIGEESSDPLRNSNARYSLSIDASKFQNIINASANLANQFYNLLNNNCVHYATDIFNIANPPTGYLGNNGFITPDDLNTYLQNTKSLNPNQKGIETDKKDLPKSTNCN